MLGLAAYFMGSIPFGLLISRLGGQGDIRNIGSGNIGATNVLRTGRKDLAVMTLAADALKGVAAVVLAIWWTGSIEVAAFAALCAVLGHCFPVWLKFNGGKGVATFVGVTFALNFYMGLIGAVVWLVVAFVFKMSSFAAMISLAATSAVAFFLLPFKAAVCVLLFCLLIAYRHKENIKRLFAGTEPKIGKSDSKSSS
ncbi:MAG: glycerol-3-phosphate 1-O-acyltransferase PlsY [Alphaproteobacteria bacterium]